MLAKYGMSALRSGSRKRGSEKSGLLSRCTLSFRKGKKPGSKCMFGDKRTVATDQTNERGVAPSPTHDRSVAPNPTPHIRVSGNLLLAPQILPLPCSALSPTDDLNRRQPSRDIQNLKTRCQNSDDIEDVIRKYFDSYQGLSETDIKSTKQIIELIKMEEDPGKLLMLFARLPIISIFSDEAKILLDSTKDNKLKMELIFIWLFENEKKLLNIDKIYKRDEFNPHDFPKLIEALIGRKKYFESLGLPEYQIKKWQSFFYDNNVCLNSVDEVRELLEKLPVMSIFSYEAQALLDSVKGNNKKVNEVFMWLLSNEKERLITSRIDVESICKDFTSNITYFKTLQLTEQTISKWESFLYSNFVENNTKLISPMALINMFSTKMFQREAVEKTLESLKEYIKNHTDQESRYSIIKEVNKSFMCLKHLTEDNMIHWYLHLFRICDLNKINPELSKELILSPLPTYDVFAGESPVCMACRKGYGSILANIFIKKLTPSDVLGVLERDASIDKKTIEELMRLYKLAMEKSGEVKRLELDTEILGLLLKLNKELSKFSDRINTIINVMFKYAEEEIIKVDFESFKNKVREEKGVEVLSNYSDIQMEYVDKQLLDIGLAMNSLSSLEEKIDKTDSINKLREKLLKKELDVITFYLSQYIHLHGWIAVGTGIHEWFELLSQTTFEKIVHKYPFLLASTEVVDRINRSSNKPLKELVKKISCYSINLEKVTAVLDPLRVDRTKLEEFCEQMKEMNKTSSGVVCETYDAGVGGLTMAIGIKKIEELIEKKRELEKRKVESGNTDAGSESEQEKMIINLEKALNVINWFPESERNDLRLYILMAYAHAKHYCNSAGEDIGRQQLQRVKDLYNKRKIESYPEKMRKLIPPMGSCDDEAIIETFNIIVDAKKRLSEGHIPEKKICFKTDDDERKLECKKIIDSLEKAMEIIECLPEPDNCDHIIRIVKEFHNEVEKGENSNWDEFAERQLELLETQSVYNKEDRRGGKVKLEMFKSRLLRELEESLTEYRDARLYKTLSVYDLIGKKTIDKYFLREIDIKDDSQRNKIVATMKRSEEVTWDKIRGDIHTEKVMRENLASVFGIDEGVAENEAYVNEFSKYKVASIKSGGVCKAMGLLREHYSVPFLLQAFTEFKEKNAFAARGLLKDIEESRVRNIRDDDYTMQEVKKDVYRILMMEEANDQLEADTMWDESFTHEQQDEQIKAYMERQGPYLTLLNFLQKKGYVKMLDMPTNFQQPIKALFLAKTCLREAASRDPKARNEELYKLYDAAMEELKIHRIMCPNNKKRLALTENTIKEKYSRFAEVFSIASVIKAEEEALKEALEKVGCNDIYEA